MPTNFFFPSNNLLRLKTCADIRGRVAPNDSTSLTPFELALQTLDAAPVSFTLIFTINLNILKGRYSLAFKAQFKAQRKNPPQQDLSGWCHCSCSTHNVLLIEKGYPA